MSFTFGFYNAKNHDRRYNAIQMSSIFDGIIEDGIFMTIGDRFQVTPNNGMVINVGPGRAWFDHTWNLNDALLPLTVSESEIILDRIDAVILEVNAEEAVRANSIKILKGLPATNPVRPSLIKTNTIHQYALAYIRVNARVTEIRTADITSMIGSGETPYVTGPLKTINIESMVAQWEDQWKVFFEKETADMSATNAFWKDQWQKWFKAQTQQIQEAYLNWEYQWTTFYKEHVNEITETANYWKEMWQKWFYDYVNKSSAELEYWKVLLKDSFLEYTGFWKEKWEEWYNTQTTDFLDWRNDTREEFAEWWDSIKDILDNPTAQFAERLLDLEERVSYLEDFNRQLIENQEVYDTAEDDSGDIILDSDHEEIIFRKLVLATPWGVVELKEEVKTLRERLEYVEEVLASLVPDGG